MLAVKSLGKINISELYNKWIRVTKLKPHINPKVTQKKPTKHYVHLSHSVRENPWEYIC